MPRPVCIFLSDELTAVWTVPTARWQTWQGYWCHTWKDWKSITIKLFDTAVYRHEGHASLFDRKQLSWFGKAARELWLAAHIATSKCLMAWISTAVTSEVKLETGAPVHSTSCRVHLGHFSGIQDACKQEEFVAHWSSQTDREGFSVFFPTWWHCSQCSSQTDHYFTCFLQY